MPRHRAASVPAVRNVRCLYRRAPYNRPVAPRGRRRALTGRADRNGLASGPPPAGLRWSHPAIPAAALSPTFLMPHREQILTWLSDAHAMEQSLASVLQHHIKDAREMPEMRERLERHLDETRQHAERVRSCLETLGSSPSAMKAIAGSAMGRVEAMSTAMFRDELLKNAIGDYAMEHFEMGCYSALAAAAEEAGLADIAETCREIFGDEAEMADWLEERIPELARVHLQHSAAAP